MHEKDGRGANGVEIETVCQHTGWAVFTGADGDEVHFIAYFTSYDRAIDYIAKCKGPDDEFHLMDGDASVVPAVIDPSDGTIMWANTGDLEKGAEALCIRHGIDPYDANRFMAEGRECNGGHCRDFGRGCGMLQEGGSCVCTCAGCGRSRAETSRPPA